MTGGDEGGGGGDAAPRPSNNLRTIFHHLPVGAAAAAAAGAAAVRSALLLPPDDVAPAVVAVLPAETPLRVINNGAKSQISSSALTLFSPPVRLEGVADYDGGALAVAHSTPGGFNGG